MQSTFKKALVAAAVMGSFAANAAKIETVNNGTATAPVAQKISAEGLAIAKTVTIGTDLTANFVTTNQYTAGDFVVFTVTGGTLANTAATQVSLGTNFSPTNIDVAAGSVTFRVVNTTGTNGQQGTTAGSYALSGIKLKDVTGPITVSAAVSAGTITFDTAAAKTIATVVTSVSAKAVTKFNGEIDVAEERKQFTNDKSELMDQAKWTAEVKADVFAPSITKVKTDLQTTGGYSFLLTDAGKLNAAQYSYAGTVALNEKDTQSLLLESTAAAQDLTLKVLDKKKGEVLETASYAADVEVSYKYGNTTDTSDFALSLGSWTLSAASVNVPYMPWGAGISQVIYISNSGKVAGAIEIEGFDDAGNEFGPVALDVVAEAESVTKLSNAITSALVAEGFSGNGKVDFTLVINSPKADIDLYAAYNVRGDRVTVPVK
jgi:hypothetical protein